MLPHENDAFVLDSGQSPRMIISDDVERELNMLSGEVKRMVVEYVHKKIRPGGLLHNLVTEEIRKRSTGGSRNEVGEERSLLLKFLDEVSSPVQTSKEFKGIKDGPLRVALFDATGNIVKSGPESSAEVEIVLIDANGNDQENNMTNEGFERRIIKAGDKKKPHFSKNVYINLKEGEGSLINQKLGQYSCWTKTLTCRLGARFVKNFRGLKVQNAWTEPFEVKDNRGQLYKNYEIPSLDSEVWRLKEIGRDGRPRERLEEKKIKTVKDLLFWLSVDPTGLQNILGAGDSRWTTIVDHARTCTIDDKMIYCHKSCTEPQMGVIYDSVGGLKGIIDGCHFVPIDSLSGDKKDDARKLLISILEPSTTFVERYTIPFNDEACLLELYPHKSSASTKCSIDSECINSYQTADPDCSSTNNIYESPGLRDTSIPIPDPENIALANLDNEIEAGRVFLENEWLLNLYIPSPDRMTFEFVMGEGDAMSRTRHASNRWKRWWFHALRWMFSISHHPKRKRQRTSK